MPLICGPKNSRYEYTGSKCPHTDLALKVDVFNLLAAIQIYEKYFNVTVKPIEDQDKYFIHLDNVTGNILWVDIHVYRFENEICVKQDLDFKLQPQDIVELGELIC